MLRRVCWRAHRGSRSRSLRPRLAAHPSSRTHTSPSAPRTEQARSMVYITDEAWLDATERQQVMGTVGGRVGWWGVDAGMGVQVRVDGCAAAYADDYHASRSLPPHPLLLAAPDRQVDVSEMFPISPLYLPHISPISRQAWWRAPRRSRPRECSCTTMAAARARCWSRSTPTSTPRLGYRVRVRVRLRLRV